MNQKRKDLNAIVSYLIFAIYVEIVFEVLSQLINLSGPYSQGIRPVSLTIELALVASYAFFAIGLNKSRKRNESGQVVHSGLYIAMLVLHTIYLSFSIFASILIQRIQGFISTILAISIVIYAIKAISCIQNVNQDVKNK